MNRRLHGIVPTLCIVVSVAAAPPAGATSERPTPISAEQAKVIAVNRLDATADGLLLRHPSRTVEFASDGVRLRARRGAPEWRWSLVEITSTTGRRLADPGPTAPTTPAPDLVRYDRCTVAEEYRFEVDSFEQRFVISEPLPLRGEDLVVRGAVSSSGDLEQSDSGWAWRNSRGEVTLGRATVVDADGELLPVRFEVDATSTLLVVDGEALLAAAYPVTIDPEIGSNDYRISDMGPDGDPDYDAVDAAVAYNSINDTYLVVWAGDDSMWGQVDEEYEIFGQVLSASGTQLGYNDVRISYAGGTGSYNTRTLNPDVAFNSNYNQFLVVWSADNPEGGCVDNEFEIWGQVVDPALFPLFGDNFRISFNGGTGDPAFDADYPAVVYNPNADEYLVVWQSDDTVQGMVDNEHEIFAQRVYSTGILVGSNLRMSDMGGSGNALYNAFSPDVAFDEDDLEYCVVWYGDDNTNGLVDDEYEIYGQLITWNGLGTGPNDFRISDMGGTGDLTYDAFHPSVVYNPTAHEYLVVWQGDDNVGGLVEGEFEVFAQRFTPDIVGVGPNDQRISDVGGIGDATYDVAWGPEVAYNPLLDEYLVVWGGEDNVGGMINDEWEIFAQALTTDIQGVGPNDERISDAGGIGELVFTTYSPVVAANSANGQFLVAWNGDDNVGSLVQGEREIFIQRVVISELFSDDFESGGLGAWSTVVP